MRVTPTATQTMMKIVKRTAATRRANRAQSYLPEYERSMYWRDNNHAKRFSVFRLFHTHAKTTTTTGRVNCHSRDATTYKWQWFLGESVFVLIRKKIDAFLKRGKTYFPRETHRFIHFTAQTKCDNDGESLEGPNMCTLEGLLDVSTIGQCIERERCKDKNGGFDWSRKKGMKEGSLRSCCEWTPVASGRRMQIWLREREWQLLPEERHRKKTTIELGLTSGVMIVRERGRQRRGKNGWKTPPVLFSPWSSQSSNLLKTVIWTIWVL